MAQALEAGAVIAKIGADIKDFKAKMGEVKDEMGDIEKEGGKIKIGLEHVGVAVIALGTAATAAIAGMVNKADEFTVSFNKMAAQTGLTTEELEKYKKEAKEIYRLGLGENISEVTQALALAGRQFKNTNTDIQGVTQKALELQKVFDMEYTESLKAASSMTKIFGTEGSKNIDLIAYALQQTGDPAGDLVDTFWEYSSQFKEMGFSAEEMTGILIKGLQNGAFNADKVGDVFKELNIRVIEMNDNTREAIHNLGLNSEQIQRQITQGGEAAKQAITEIMSRIGRLQNQAQAKSIASILMGAPGEDIGMQFFQSFANSVNIAAEATGTLNKAIEQFNNNNLGELISQIGREFGLMGNAIGQVFVPMLAAVLRGVLSVAQGFTNLLEAHPIIAGIIGVLLGLVSVLGMLTAAVFAFNSIWTTWKTFIGIVKGAEIATKAWTAAQAALNVVMNANPVGLIIMAVAALIGLIAVVVEKTIGWKNVWNGVVNFFKKSVDFIKRGLASIANFFTYTLPKAVMKFVDIVTKPLRFFMDLFLMPFRLGAKLVGVNIPMLSSADLSSLAGGSKSVNITNNITANSIDRGNINDIERQLSRNMSNAALGVI